MPECLDCKRAFNPPSFIQSYPYELPASVAEFWQTKFCCALCSRFTNWSGSRFSRDGQMTALKRVGYSVNVRPEEIFDRDDWRCYLCSGAVHSFKTEFFTPGEVREKVYAEALTQGKVILPHIESTWEYKLSASLDHYLPIAGNGTHTLDNLFCCCLQCNQRKNGSSAYEEIAREIFRGDTFDTLGQWREVAFDPPLSIQEVGSL